MENRCGTEGEGRKREKDEEREKEHEEEEEEKMVGAEEMPLTVRV